MTARRTLRGRIAAPAVRTLAAVLQRLPERPQHALAGAAGSCLYYLWPRRRRLVTANLRRVCRYLADKGMANEATAAAARDDAALKRMARIAFGHYLRGYLEGALLPGYARSSRAAPVEPDDPQTAAQMLATRPLLIVGLHFGAIELPALWASQHGVSITTPMETVADPDLQAYFVASRSATGLRIIPLAGAASELSSVLAHKGVAAVVADRPIGGRGVAVELFGAKARLPVGPAALAANSGAEAWLVTTRRIGHGQYRSQVELIPMTGASQRERVATFLIAEARAFERAVALAPEQWWTVFFPIWLDIA